MPCEKKYSRVSLHPRRTDPPEHIQRRKKNPAGCTAGLKNGVGLGEVTDTLVR